MNKAQQQMLDDGLPKAFIMTKAERHALWEANPPKNTQAFLDPRIEQDRKLREQIKQEQTQKRISALRASKGLNPIYNLAINPDHTQENSMSKYVIKPLDRHGHPVTRGMTSINNTAAEDQINEKVLAAIKRGGTKVVNVLLINTLGEVVLAWEVTRDLDGLNAEAGPCDAGPFQPTTTALEAEPGESANEPDAQAAPEGQTEEANMAKKPKKTSKGKKVAKVKTKSPRKAKAAGEFKKGSKMELVYNLFTRKSGVTSDEMLKATGWKAVGMIQQAKACGLKIKKEKTDKGTRYFAV